MVHRLRDDVFIRFAPLELKFWAEARDSLCESLNADTGMARSYERAIT
jgi:hypothetical protein